MDLPVLPPVAPMLSKAASELPSTPGLVFEPKWDGFRCIVFRDGDEVELGSRNERPLTRYFPEVVDAVRAELPARCVVDGEVVIARTPDSGALSGLDFDALLNRIHPAASRVKLLSTQTPASFIAFDVLALGDDDVRTEGFSSRRARLEGALAACRPPVHITPATRDRDVALDWFERFEGAGLDGIVAKAPDVPYREGERAMIKVKHVRTADMVVAGYRWHKSGPVVGSLLLGLYDEGRLHHIGVASSFTAKRRATLVDELAPYVNGAADGHPWAGWAEAEAHTTGQRIPGATSRWNAGRDLSFVLLRPELVVEVAYEQLQGHRLRHPARFVRWRPDRTATSCTYQQLETAVPAELAAVFDA